MKMTTKEEIAKHYFDSFHNGNLDQVYEHLSKDCLVQYGTEKPAKADDFYPSILEMIKNLKFETRGHYFSPQTNKVLIDFS